jgi:hypothetical protein
VQDVLTAAFQGIGGAAGARPLGLIGDPKFQSLWQRIAETLPKLPDATEQQTILLGTLNDQTKRAITNFDTLAADIGMTVVPGFQSLAMKAGDVASALDRFVLGHPRATGVGIEGMEVGTGMAAIAAATGLARLGAFALGLGVATDGLLAFGGELGLAVLALVEITRAVDAFAGWMMPLGKRPTGRPLTPADLHRPIGELPPMIAHGRSFATPGSISI